MGIFYPKLENNQVEDTLSLALFQVQLDLMITPSN